MTLICLLSSTRNKSILITLNTLKSILKKKGSLSRRNTSLNSYIRDHLIALLMSTIETMEISFISLRSGPLKFILQTLKSSPNSKPINGLLQNIFTQLSTRNSHNNTKIDMVSLHRQSMPILKKSSKAATRQKQLDKKLLRVII